MKFHLAYANQIAWTSLFATLLALAGISGVTAQNRQTTPAPSAAPLQQNATTQTTGFYCNLKALTPAEREQHHQLTQKLAAARVETTELANGFAFRLQSGGVSLADLAAWISAESKCCPFFDFEIELQRDGGPLWLKLRGSEGVKAFMRNEFPIR